MKNAISNGAALVIKFRIGIPELQNLMITAYLPDAADLAAYNELTNAIFYVSNTYRWGMKIQGSRWECDDMSFNTADTLHQIWFKRAQNPYESNMIFNFEALNEHVEGGKWSNAISSESYGDGSISEGIARSTISTSLESDPPSIVFSGGATNADWKDAVLLPKLDLKRDWSFEIKSENARRDEKSRFLWTRHPWYAHWYFLTVMKSRGIEGLFSRSGTAT